MSENNSVWNSIFARDGRVFTQPNENMPGLCALLKERGAKKILDLGCGSGRHVIFLSRAGFDVCGLDNAPHALELTRQWLEDEGLTAELRQGNMFERLPFPDAAFDGVLTIAAVHHARLAEIKGVIAEIYRVLKCNGSVFVAVPWKGGEDNGVPAEEIEPDTFVPLEGSEKGLPHHFFSEESLRDAFGAFEILETHIDSQKRYVYLTASKI